MKKLICLLGLIVLGLIPAGAQPNVPFTGQPVPFRPPGMPASQDESKLTTFDLDFPGGTPADLVQAVEKATGKPLNAIIPTEDADTQLPPLKMNNVVVPHLFAALESASQHIVTVSVGSFVGSYTQSQVGYGFRTSDNPITDNSIWNFYVQKPSLPPVVVPPIVSNAPICRFYQLQDYLNNGFTVDDITTAIQTGWKMSGVTSPPELNYHKETKLLIAYGKPEELQTIENVLSALPQNKSNGNSISDQVGQAFKIARMEGEIKQLNEQVSFLTTNSTEKSSGK